MNVHNEKEGVQTETCRQQEKNYDEGMGGAVVKLLHDPVCWISLK